MTWLRRVRFLTPNMRLLLFIVPMGLLGLALWVGPISAIPAYNFRVSLSPIALFLVSAAGASLSLDVRIHKLPISLSLTEVSLVLGLFLVPPPTLIICTISGVAVAHWIKRGVRPIWDLANICVDTFYVAVAVLVLNRFGIQPGDGLSVHNMEALAATVVIAVTVLPVVVNISIWFYNAEINIRNTLTAVGMEMVASLVNACLGVIGLVFALSQWWLSVVLLPPIALVYLGQIASSDRQEQVRRMQFLYELSELLHTSGNLVAESNELLDHLVTMFGAERAQLIVITERGNILRIRSGVGDDSERVTSTELTRSEKALLDKLGSGHGDAVRAGLTAPPELNAVLEDHHAREGLAAALRSGGEELGMVLILDPPAQSRRSRVRTNTTSMLSSVARQIGTALAKGQLADEVRVMSRERIELNRRLFHDPLTRLANRMLFQDRLIHGLAQTARSDAPLGVLFVDLDNFKAINDAYGHDVGDLLLIDVAKRLRDCVRDTDTPARFAGDEFAVLCEQMISADDAVHVAERIVLSLAQPHQLRDDISVTVRASIGIAVITPAMRPAEVSDVLRWADTAMYAAKRRGKGSYAIFEPGMDGALSERLAFEVEMRRALAGDELFVQFQPIVSTKDKAVVGAEALVRWMHPVRGLLPPGDFIPLAEETGFIVPLGEWVLNEVCKRLAEWAPLIEGKPFYVSVNVSAQELLIPHFQEGVERRLKSMGVAPERIVAEVTETALLADMVVAKDRLAALREFGIRIALDDFGTGFSSLSYLHDLPVDIIKIDRCFLAKRRNDDRHKEFLRAIYTLGRSLGLVTVAEGVEDAADLELLARMHVEYAQGYHIARPMDAARFVGQIGGDASASRRGERVAS